MCKLIQNINMPNKCYLLIFTLLLSACSSVTMRPYGGIKEKRAPDYSDSKDYYFLGLVGEHEINTSEVCGDRRVDQMQAVTTSSDWIRGVFTLFIYSPRTAKVWCEELPDYEE
jgi:Bor protein